MSTTSNRELASELFDKVESAGAGLFALSLLMRKVGEHELEEFTWNGLAHLLGVVGEALLQHSDNGRQLCHQVSQP